jgi:acetyl esterase
MTVVNRDVEALIAAGKAAGALPFEALSPEAARIAYAERRRRLQLPPDAVANRRDLTIDGPGGLLGLRCYRGAGTDPDAALPVLLFLHGGGWMLGDLDSHDGVCCRLANGARCAVVAVDYRTAPEHPFPAAVDDATAVLAFVARDADTLRLDAQRLAVGGDSAGGNLAAVLAILGRDGVVPAPLVQLLLYPVVDLVMASGSYASTTAGMTITPATMRWFVDHYAPDEASRTDWRASPLRAPSLAGVAPALVLTCGHDPLRDEGIGYADRLEREGVAVTRLHLSDQTHGMLTMTAAIRASVGVLDFAADTLRQAFDVGR